MRKRSYQSWGRYPQFDQSAVEYLWRHESLPWEPSCGKTFLPFGNGRSYGDVCLNQDGILVDCRRLDRFISFDSESGVLRCEAGVLLADILEFSVPIGWFLPVTPGTKFVTVGGAIANDVHGKNHHRRGTFGRHVLAFELLRSDGVRRRCSPGENADWFGATVGGLGLTGVITWAEIALQPISTPFIHQEIIRYESLDDFFSLSAESDETHEYTVAWVDCLAGGASLGRGLFIRGNHATVAPGRSPGVPSRSFRLGVSPPFSLVNRLSLRVLNALYYRKTLSRRSEKTVHFGSFFYPLDAIVDWNRIYGPRGFLQYQCAIPDGSSQQVVREILRRISGAKTGSFLAVLKRFGSIPSPGLLSFPCPGVTLALDFPNRGEKTLALLETLDEIVGETGGAVNPSKDARMTAGSFQSFFPQWERLLSFKDPAISSSFWRRVTSQTPASTTDSA